MLPQEGGNFKAKAAVGLTTVAFLMVFYYIYGILWLAAFKYYIRLKAWGGVICPFHPV